jgi:hypothetical protein
MKKQVIKNDFENSDDQKHDEFISINPFEDSGVGRREFCFKSSIGLAAAFMATFPWTQRALAAIASPYQKSSPPIIKFTRNRTLDGIIGPFGEARIYKYNGEALPMLVVSRDASAIIDLTGRSPFIRIGSDLASAIYLNADGVMYGSKSRLQPWNARTIQALIAALARDKQKANAIILLRSALHTSYPVAVKEFKARMNRKMVAKLSQGSAKLGTNSLKCTTTTVTDTVTNTVTQTVEVIKTAQQQYQECYDREVQKDPCKSAGIFAGACAAGACGLKTFVDMIVGFTTIVTTVTEEVVREVVSCQKPLIGTWPNPWDISNKNLTNGAVSQPAVKFGASDVAGAIKFLKDLTGVFGPFGKCFLDGKWGLAQLETPLDLGNGKIVIPFGVRVCITAECARQLSIGNIGSELLVSWGAALGALAALSTEAAAILVPLGVVATPSVVAFAGTVSPVIVAIATVILAFIIILLIHGTILSAELAYQDCCTNNLADGTVCIEHPTFAVALLTILQAGHGAPTALLIPPTVTG